MSLNKCREFGEITCKFSKENILSGISEVQGFWERRVLTSDRLAAEDVRTHKNSGPIFLSNSAMCSS
jgi:hypothetical protein